jgi:hypothetical protein
VSQERASGQSRPGIKTFACHHIRQWNVRRI